MHPYMKNHVTQNGCRVQVLRNNDITTVQEARFIALCQVSSCIQLLRKFHNYGFSMYTRTSCQTHPGPAIV